LLKNEHSIIGDEHRVDIKIMHCVMNHHDHCYVGTGVVYLLKLCCHYTIV